MSKHVHPERGAGYCPTPDVHNRPHPRGGIPLVRPGQIFGAPGRRGGALYHAGYAAGRRWAAEVASFEELGHVEDARRAPFVVPGPFLRGFIDGAIDLTETQVETCA